MVIFRQLFDPESSTYTYLLADSETHEALIIDPVYEQVRRDVALLEELKLKLGFSLETHVHADHVTGGWSLKQRTGSRIALSAASGAEGADRYLEHGEKIYFGDHYLEARATPGHTSGCMTFVLDDMSRAFTGDCLLIRGCGRTDFQEGDSRVMYRSIHEQIFSLPDDCLLYPGHDYRGLTATSVAEEKLYNPRLGGELNESDFAGYMDNLGLAHPKKLEIAVPANLKCGKQEEGAAPADEPSWAPLTFTFAGIWEVQPQWLEDHLKDIQIVDVRESSEFEGPLGRIPGAELIPLGQLTERAAELSMDKPIVAVCRAGGRSAQATLMLRRAGFENVANLAGGMLRWRAQRCPVEGAKD
jgi:glyoxylase-like metal-dependent hydrolase (beta-lactamase superfamily II)/rhodanese-related sulfurtransferase